MRSIFIISILLASFVVSLNAQQRKVDSLAVVLKSTNNSKEKIVLYHQIISSTWDFDFERALSFAQQEYDLAVEIDDAESRTIALTDLGMYYYFTGDYHKASAYYKSAIEAAEGKNFGEFPAYTLTRIGNLYRVQGQFDSALVYYSRTEKLLKRQPPGVALASLYFHYGWLYHDLSEYEKGLGYLYRARDIRYQVGDSLLIAECWRVIGTCHFGMNRIDSASYYLDKTMRIAKSYGDDELIVFTSINNGDIFSVSGQTIEAIRSYELALELLSKHNFKRYKALALFHVGKVFDSRGDYVRALEYYLSALKINEELKSKQEIARIYGWIGWAHNNLRNQITAKEHARHSLMLMKEIKDHAGEAFAYNLLGQIFFREKEYDYALAYYDTALQIRKSLQLELLVSNTLYNMARIYEMQKKYNEALKFYFDDLDLAMKMNNKRIIAIANNSIGMVYAYKNDFVKAERYMKASQMLLTHGGAPVDRRDNFLNFARLYRMSGKQSKATDYYEQFIKLNDSIINRDNTMAAMQRDALYQLDKKESEIKELNAQNELKEEQIELQYARIRFQNLIIVVSVLGLILVSIVAYMLYKYYRSKTIANRELSKLNKEVYEQKEEIQAQAEELIEASHTIQEINKGLEAAVEERTLELKQAYKELDTFIYRSSHDFRRPLTTFMGLAEVAKISVKDSTAIELFMKVNDTAHNLDRMLGKLQAVSQIASTELILREVSFDSELDVVLDLYRSIIIEKRIRIERSVIIDRPYISYPLIVRVILENLIENAICFSTPQNPVIQIRVMQSDSEVTIRVVDNGEGIAQEFHNRLFEMYFRANEKSKGNGLGLYLVKKAAGKLEAKIDFTSTIGEGSAFTVFLPYSEKIKNFEYDLSQ